MTASIENGMHMSATWGQHILIMCSHSNTHTHIIYTHTHVLFLIGKKVVVFVFKDRISLDWLTQNSICRLAWP